MVAHKMAAQMQPNEMGTMSPYPQFHAPVPPRTLLNLETARTLGEYVWDCSRAVSECRALEVSPFGAR